MVFRLSINSTVYSTRETFIFKFSTSILKCIHIYSLFSLLYSFSLIVLRVYFSSVLCISLLQFFIDKIIRISSMTRATFAVSAPVRLSFYHSIWLEYHRTDLWPPCIHGIIAFLILPDSLYVSCSASSSRSCFFKIFIAIHLCSDAGFVHFGR